MKKLMIGALVALIMVANLHATTYKVDKSHSSVGFKIKHMMISNVRGTFDKFNGSVEFDEKKKAITAINGTVTVDSINTGNGRRDGHLKADDMFDVKKYPTIKFKATKIKNGKAYGKFTMRGVTKDVVFDVEFGGMMGNKIGLALEGEINRKDYGLTYNRVLESGGFALGETVKIIVEIEAKK
ncbi:MAG: YceI family protein [Campylobacterales bacterium]|nr:YceI family protein [Campylobacterales bacterium]